MKLLTHPSNFGLKRDIVTHVPETDGEERGGLGYIVGQREDKETVNEAAEADRKIKEVGDELFTLDSSKCFYVYAGIRRPRHTNIRYDIHTKLHTVI